MLTEKRKAEHDDNFDQQRRETRNRDEDASTLHDGFSATSYPLDMHDVPGESGDITLAKEQARYEFKRNLQQGHAQACQPPNDAKELTQRLDRRTAQKQRRAARAAANQGPDTQPQLQQ